MSMTKLMKMMCCPKITYTCWYSPNYSVVQPKADEVAEEEVEVAGTNEPDEQEIDIDALTPQESTT